MVNGAAKWRFALVLSIASLLLPGGGQANAQRSIVVASTTSTQNSGLFDHILPKFEAATRIAVRVIAQGTGQALRTAQNGDADAVFVHDPVA